MGQRSQIFVRVNGDLRIAQYFQWNYAERMISRARYGIEHMAEYVLKGYEWAFELENAGELGRFRRIFETNFDMKDVQISHDILKEYKEYANEFFDSLTDYCFRGQDNNDGQLLIDIDTKNAKFKYAFVCPWEPDEPPMDADQYIEWDCCPEWREVLGEEASAYTGQNISKIGELADLMTAEEVKEYTTKDYVGAQF